MIHNLFLFYYFFNFFLSFLFLITNLIVPKSITLKMVSGVRKVLIFQLFGFW